MRSYHTKRIALPGGKVIEIVYFHEPDAPGDGADEQQVAAAVGMPEALEAERLHVCPDCGSDLVYPVAWEEREDDRWRIRRRCPNCEWRHTGDFDQPSVEGFDDVLNDGTEYLLTALREFARANMAADVERLIAAINADLIQPIDF